MSEKVAEIIAGLGDVGVDFGLIKRHAGAEGIAAYKQAGTVWYYRNELPGLVGELGGDDLTTEKICMHLLQAGMSVENVVQAVSEELWKQNV